MGVSNDAFLVYGIDLGEDLPSFLGEDQEFEDFLMDEGGQPKWGEPGHSFDKQRAYLASCPADLTLYCSYDYPMHILSVRGTDRRASRGNVEEVESLDVDADKRTGFIDWCIAHGIENPEPKWLLNSMNG